MKSFWKIPLKSVFPHSLKTKHSDTTVTPKLQDYILQFFSVKYPQFNFTQIPLYFKDFRTQHCFPHGNKRNRRSRRVESQSSDRDKNTSETSFTQGNATLVEVSKNVNIFDRNLGSELTEPSQISNEIKAITQRLSDQNNHTMTQIDQQLNSNLEEILKGIRSNKKSNLANDEEDAEDNRPSTSNPKNKHLGRKHASNNEIDKERNQDNRFQSSEIYEVGQPSTSFGVANETLDDTIITNENRQEAEFHMMTGRLGLADYHRS